MRGEDRRGDLCVNGRGGRKDSSVLLFLEDGPNGFDGLGPV